MAQGSILHVMADKDLPEQLVEKLLAEYNSYVGAAFIVEGSPEVVFQHDYARDLKSIKEMREAFKEYPMFMCFHKFPEHTFHEDDSQPYIILPDDEDRPILMCMMEGDFSKHTLEGSPRAPVYFALENFIQPRIEQFFRLSKGDLNIVMEEMMKENVKNEFADLVSDRGSIVLIPFKGEAIHYGIDISNMFVGDWGWVTNSCGYKEGEFPEKTEAPVSAQDRLRELIKKKVAVKKPVDVVSSPPVPDPVPVTAVPKLPLGSGKTTQVGDTKVIHPTENVSSVLASSPFFAAPPKGLSHNQTKKWYETNHGSRPKDWHARPAVTILPSRVNAVKKELGFLEDKKGTVLKTLSAVGQVLGIKPTTEVSDKEAATQHPDVTDITVDTFTKNVEPTFIKKVEPEHIKSSPVLSAKALEFFHKEFMSNPTILKWMKAAPPSLEALQAIEKKLPNFYEQTGLQLDNLMTDEQIMDIVYKHQDVTVLLLKTVLVERANWKAEKELAKKFTEVTAPAPTKKIVVRKKVS